MVQIIKEINVEVSKPNLFPAIIAKQYDNNSRFIKATLVDAGINIDVDPTFTATINVTRPDGESRRCNGVVNKDGTVTVPLTAWALELSGTIQCDISVCGADSKLTSTLFNVLVEEASCTNDSTFLTVGDCSVTINSNVTGIHFISYNGVSSNGIVPCFVEPDSAIYILSPKTIENVACGSAIVIAVNSSTAPKAVVSEGASVEKIQGISANCYHVVVAAPRTSGISATINITL